MKRRIYWALMAMLHKILLHDDRKVGSSSDYRRIQLAADTRTVMAVQKWVDEKQYCMPDQTMTEVADKIGISKDQLSRYCRHIEGMSFLTWRKFLRMGDAKLLLLNDRDMPATQVGELVGIYDRNNFRKQFYEVVRCTPSEWRERNPPAKE